MKCALPFCLGLIAATILFAGRPAFAQYTITEVNACGDSTVDVGGLSRQDIIVGSCFVESGNPVFPLAITPFLIDRSGARELPRVPGGLYVFPVGVNRRAEVIANRYYPGPTQAFVWHGSEPTELGTLGGEWSEAKGINNLGHIVGVAGLPDGTGHAFLYQDGVMRDLGTFGADYGVASAINDHVELVINRTYGTNFDTCVPDCPLTRAAIYSRGKIVPLGSIGGRDTIGFGINSRGHVVGVSSFPAEESAEIIPSHVFYYHDGRIEDLHLLFPGLVTTTSANSINSRDEIVGSWSNYFDAERVDGAFLFRDGTVVDLATLLPPGSEWSIKTGNFISDAGHIVGTGYHQGNYRWYLLTPTNGDHRH